MALADSAYMPIELALFATMQLAQQKSTIYRILHDLEHLILHIKAAQSTLHCKEHQACPSPGAREGTFSRMASI